jgi:hypothetical protein
MPSLFDSLAGLSHSLVKYVTIYCHIVIYCQHNNIDAGCIAIILVIDLL